jgi:hypothetical protein
MLARPSIAPVPEGALWALAIVRIIDAFLMGAADDALHEGDADDTVRAEDLNDGSQGGPIVAKVDRVRKPLLQDGLEPG